MLFRFLRTSLEYFLHLWSVLKYVYFPLFHFYELVVNFNHYELGLITLICACLGMTDFGTYNKSHGPARKNTDPGFWFLCSIVSPGHNELNESIKKDCYTPHSQYEIPGLTLKYMGHFF